MSNQNVANIAMAFAMAAGGEADRAVVVEKMTNMVFEPTQQANSLPEPDDSSTSSTMPLRRWPPTDFTPFSAPGAAMGCPYLRLRLPRKIWTSIKSAR